MCERVHQRTQNLFYNRVPKVAAWYDTVWNSFPVSTARTGLVIFPLVRKVLNKRELENEDNLGVMYYRKT